MRISTLFAAAVFCVLLGLPAVASADNTDIPGTAMTVGSTVKGVVDESTRPDDVYSVSLVSGEQVQITATDPGSGYVSVRLIAPGATSIQGPYTSLGYTSSGGSAPLLYTPAKDGVYYLRVSAQGHGISYSVTVARTGAPAVVAPDSDDIFGIPIGVGAAIGIVDEDTDADDVFAVALFAQEQVQITATDPGSGYVSVRLIAPGATSIQGSYTSLGYTSSGGLAPLLYTPAKDGVYYLRVSAQGHGVPYTLTLSGSAEKPPYPSALRLRASATKVRAGKSVTLRATLVDLASVPGATQTVTLRSSYNRTTWKTVGSLRSTSGIFSKSVKVKRKTWFQMSFSGDADSSGCVSRRVVVAIR